MRSIFIPVELRDQILAHVEARLPEEACGLLGGTGEKVEVVIPVENELHQLNRFRMSANEQVKAMLTIENLGMEIVSIFHSHPRGPDSPSGTDIREHFYPESALIICSKRNENWKMRGFMIRGVQVEEIGLIND